LLDAYIKSDYSEDFLIKELENVGENLFYYTGHHKLANPELFKEQIKNIGRFIPQIEYYQKV
jgi:hypothetical protein